MLLMSDQGHRFALPVNAVRAVVRLPALQAPEGMPASVVGLVDFHGALTPVIDLRKRLGHPGRAMSIDDLLVVLALQGGSLLGVLASTVDEVRVPDRRLEGGDFSHSRGALIGAAEVEGQLFLIIDPDSLLSDEPGMGRTEPATDLRTLDAAYADVLEERATTLRAVPATSGAEEILYVGFEIAGESFWAPATTIQHIHAIGAISLIPGVPAHVLGLASVGGEVATVLDVRSALDVVARPLWEPGLMLLTELDEHLIGIAVDSVDDVVTVTESLKPLPVSARESQGAWSLGMLDLGGDSTPVIDLTLLVNDPEFVVDQPVEMASAAT